MNFRTDFPLIALGAGAIIFFLAAWLVWQIPRWRRKDPAELERLRRLDVNRRGRVTPGWVVDVVDAATAADHAGVPSRLIAYKYQVAGVTYEAAQDVSGLARVEQLAPGWAGRPADVKYDPHRPTNSIIACEEWCGIQDAPSH